jgi:hypothetical protein
MLIDITGIFELDAFIFWVDEKYTLWEEWLQYVYKVKAHGKVRQKAAQHLTATHNTVLIWLGGGGIWT